jgi:hypothetical protein
LFAVAFGAVLVVKGGATCLYVRQKTT